MTLHTHKSTVLKSVAILVGVHLKDQFEQLAIILINENFSEKVSVLQKVCQVKHIIEI